MNAHTLYMREWRLKNPDKVKAAAKATYLKHRESRLARARARNKAKGFKERNAALRQRALIDPEYRVKCLARLSLGEAVRRGRVIRPQMCTLCLFGCTPEGHHQDYLKRLEVVWLCSVCHKGIHERLVSFK